MSHRFFIHRHIWQSYLNRANAYFSKRSRDIEKHWYVGKIMKCNRNNCGSFLFVPFNSELYAVECEKLGGYQNVGQKT